MTIGMWYKGFHKHSSMGTAINGLGIGRKAVEFDPIEYHKFKYHCYVQKSYVPTSMSTKNHIGTITNLFNKNQSFVISFTQ